MPSLFFKFFCCLLLTAILGTSPAKSLVPKKSPGVIESLEILLSLHKKQFRLFKSQVSRNPKVLSGLTKVQDIGLHPFFVRSILFHSEDKYINLAGNDTCQFYALIENDLLKTAEGRIENVIVNFKSAGGKIETALLTKNDFLNQIYKTKCPTKKETSLLFNQDNLKKTLKKVLFPVPKNQQDCQAILEDWIKNPLTPYLCKIPESINQGLIAKKKLETIDDTNFSLRRIFNEKIRRADFYKKEITYFERSYLNNLCYGLSNKEKFCKPYVADDIWSKVLNGEYPKYNLVPKCKNLYQKNSLNINQLRSCAQKLKEDIKFCFNKGNISSLIPMPNCSDLSEALMASKLRADYQDCPGLLNNEGITNIHRIINHIENSSINSNSKNCTNQANSTFSKLLFDFNYQESWPLKICYMDKIEEMEKCLPYIPGNNEDDKLSESNVIAHILHKTRGYRSNLKCKLIHKTKFNPNFLEFKSGCYIVFDQNECTSQYCPKKVLYNLKEIKDIKYTGEFIFDYFPTNFRKEKFSLSNILKEVYKLKTLKIRNFTDLIFFLDRKESNIVHGIGCLEDLIPSMFPKSYLNQCSPSPFIIDGYLKKNDQVNMVTRVSLDDIHSPRMIPWNFIFNSIASYRSLHPLDTWTLYGIQLKNKEEKN